MYDLENLIKKFIEHGKILDQNQKELIDSFVKNNPGQPLSDYLKDDFNLPLALVSICSELLALKEKVAAACAQEKL